MNLIMNIFSWLLLCEIFSLCSGRWMIFFFFSLKILQLVFLLLLVGHGQVQTEGRWPLPEEVWLQHSAIGGCPRVSREEHEKWIICIKKKKPFSFLTCESKVEHCLLSQIPWIIMKFLFTWGRFSQSKKTKEILTFIWQRFIYRSTSSFQTYSKFWR